MKGLAVVDEDDGAWMLSGELSERGKPCEPATCHGADPWSLEIWPNQSLNRFYDQVWWIFVAR